MSHLGAVTGIQKSLDCQDGAETRSNDKSCADINLATASSESIFASFSSSEAAPPLVISGTPVCVCVSRTGASEKRCRQLVRESGLPRSQGTHVANGYRRLNTQAPPSDHGQGCVCVRLERARPKAVKVWEQAMAACQHPTCRSEEQPT